MAGTIIGVLISLYAAWTYFTGGPLVLPEGTFFAVIGFLMMFLLMAPLSILLALQPLSRMEKGFTPGVTKLFWNQKRVRLYLVSATALPPLFILSFIFFPDGIVTPLLIGLPIAIGWLCDSLRHFLLSTMQMTVPTEVIAEFSEVAAGEMERGQLADFVFWSRTLGSTVMKAIDRKDHALAVETMREQTLLADRFIQTLAVHFIEGDPIEEESNYALMAVLQDQEQYFFAGLEEGADLLVIQSLTSMSRIILTLSQRAPVKAHLAMHQFADLIAVALDEERPDLAMKGIYSLGQVVKDLSNTVSIETLSDRLAPIIGHMEEISQEMFKRDKEIDIEFLAHPFRMMLGIFENKGLKDRAEVEPTLKQINKVLADFASLTLVVQKMKKEK